jgi:hypothetical protein
LKIINHLRFFVTRLQRTILNREYKNIALSENLDVDIDEFALEKIKKQAKDELEKNWARVVYRAKYNLPPNDPRFLELTDEEILHELVLQLEYSKWCDNRFEEEDPDENKIIYRNTDEYNDIVKRMEKGENIDLDAMMTSLDEWEKIDG